MATEAAKLTAASPHAAHSIVRWLRPGVASRLKRADGDAWGLGGVLQPARRQLAALDSAHRRRARGGGRGVAAPERNAIEGFGWPLTLTPAIR
jgi:hypothetical protein